MVVNGMELCLGGALGGQGGLVARLSSAGRRVVTWAIVPRRRANEMSFSRESSFCSFCPLSFEFADAAAHRGGAAGANSVEFG
jgi:hypothetical protein